MPGKSRRKKGKYSFQTKIKKRRPSHPATLTQQPAIIPTHEAVPSPKVSVPSAKVPAPMTKLAEYPYIATELRTIAILAVIMLIALVVLALVLS